MGWQRLRTAAAVLGLTILLLGVPRLAGVAASTFDYSGVDPDGAFAWISVHHVVQGFIFLVIMAVVTRRTGIRFGFGRGDPKIGLRWVRVFALIFAGYALVSFIIAIATGTFRQFPYPLTAQNIIGQLGFQLLLSGPSEELIFRAFAITALGGWLKGSLFGGALSHANILAAIIFALAHVQVGLPVLTLTFDPFQLAYATALGLAYGVCYERSGSMYYPMAMHSLSNVAAVGVSILAGVSLAG